MSTPRAMRMPFGLTMLTAGFLAFWVLIATFPLFWIAIISFKLPVDAFSSDFARVILGPQTRAARGGLSALDLGLGLLLLAALYQRVSTAAPPRAGFCNRGGGGATAGASSSAWAPSPAGTR